MRRVWHWQHLSPLLSLRVDWDWPTLGALVRSLAWDEAIHAPSLSNFPSPPRAVHHAHPATTMNASPSLARTSSWIHRRTKRPICAISSKERTDRLHTGHTFKRVRETQWVRIAEKQILSTSADFKQQSDGRDYLGSKEAALHTTQQKGPKELLVIPFMFVFTGNPAHLFLFFYAKASKHGTLCRLMKLNSSEHNGRSFLSCVLELDVLALPQHWHKYISFFKMLQRWICI